MFNHCQINQKTVRLLSLQESLQILETDFLPKLISNFQSIFKLFCCFKGRPTNPHAFKKNINFFKMLTLKFIMCQNLFFIFSRIFFQQILKMIYFNFLFFICHVFCCNSNLFVQIRSFFEFKFIIVREEWLKLFHHRCHDFILC